MLSYSTMDKKGWHELFETSFGHQTSTGNGTVLVDKRRKMRRCKVCYDYQEQKFMTCVPTDEEKRKAWIERLGPRFERRINGVKCAYICRSHFDRLGASKYRKARRLPQFTEEQTNIKRIKTSKAEISGIGNSSIEEEPYFEEQTEWGLGDLVIPNRDNPRPSLIPKQEIEEDIEELTVIRPEISENDQLIISMICRDRLPVTMLDGTGFRRLLDMMNPGFLIKEIPYYTEVALPLLKTELEEKIRLDLIYANKVTLTFDLIRTSSDGPNCISVMAYWMTPETMEPKNSLIIYETDGEHTRMNAKLINSKFAKFGIQHKIIGLINHKVSFDFADGSIRGLDRMMSLSCFEGKLLDVIAHSMYFGHPDLRQKQASTLLEFRSMSKRHGNQFSSIRVDENHLTTRILENQEFMSWHHLFGMMYYLVDTSLLSDFHHYPGEKRTANLTTEELDITKFMYSILEEFKKAFDSIQHRNYPTASVIIPTLGVLMHQIERLETAENNTNSSIKEQVISEIQKHSAESQNNMTLKTATFLDPRFRDGYFSSSHKDFMMENFREAGGIHEKEIKEEPKVFNGNMSLFDQYLQNKGRLSQSVGPSGELEKEIDEYLKEDPNSQTNPIDFWITNQDKLPVLKSLASDYLAIPASSNGAEKYYEDGQKMWPISKECSNGTHDDLVFCSANIENYGSF